MLKNGSLLQVTVGLGQLHLFRDTFDELVSAKVIYAMKFQEIVKCLAFKSVYLVKYLVAMTSKGYGNNHMFVFKGHDDFL